MNAQVAQAASQLVAQGTAAGVGAAVGGTQGAALAFNVDANNRQLHPTEAKLIRDNAARFAKMLFKTETPSTEQVAAATSMLVNTAQNMLDNNIDVAVPYFKNADDFLQSLKLDYQQQNGTLVLPGTSGEQQLFYATVEQKNQTWLNQGLADPQITGLIIRTPLNPPKANELPDSSRDKLTGLPLDATGRYTRQVSVGDPINGYANYAPKFFPCATTDCVNSNASLDMSDSGTRAYVKALDAQIFKDIGAGATVATLASPTGVVAGLLSITGTGASIIVGGLEDKAGTALAKEALQGAANKYLSRVYGLGEAAISRISGVVDLAGGWQAFIDRTLNEINESSK